MSNLPLVLYDNILRSAESVTASSEQASNPAVSAYDWLLHTSWIPDADGASTLTVDMGVGQTAVVNAIAIYRHTLATTGGTIAVEWSSDGVVWNDLLLPFTPSSNTVAFVTFAGKTERYFRITLTETPAAGLGLVALGEAMEIQNGFRTGYSAPLFSRNVVSRSSRSDSGLPIGRSVVDKGITGVFRIHDVTEEWAREKLLPFIEHVERYHFFLLWNEDMYPDEAAIIESSESRIAPFTYSKHGFISGGFKYAGWQ